MSSLAEQHAKDPSSGQHWADRARRLNPPTDRPAVFYESFDDGSFVQVTIAPGGNPVISPGVSYDDARAQQVSTGG